MLSVWFILYHVYGLIVIICDNKCCITVSYIPDGIVMKLTCFPFYILVKFSFLIIFPVYLR